MEERLLNLPTLARASGFLGPIKVLTGMIGYFWVLIHSSWHWGEILNYYDPVYQKATTMCLLAIVVTQIANDFVCRGAKESILNLGFFSNRLLLLGVGCEIVLGIAFVYLPPFQSILNPRALGINDWFLLIPFPLFLFLAEEVRKKVSSTKI